MADQTFDQFGPFTQEDVRTAFRSFDLDKNNYIGAAELRHIYMSIGEEVTDEEIDEMIRMVDLDGDGQVSHHEFSKMIFRYAAQIPSDGSAGEIIHHDTRLRTEQSMGQDDVKNAGGFAPAHHQEGLSAAKSKQRQRRLEEYLHDLGYHSSDIKQLLTSFMTHPDRNKETIDYQGMSNFMKLPPSDSLQALFNLFDDDLTGRINLKGFIVTMSNFSPDSSKDDKIKFAFRLFDADESGSLTHVELVEILKANYMATNSAQVQKKAQAIMRQADKDGDHTISFDEFLSVCKRFPNLLFPTFS